MCIHICLYVRREPCMSTKTSASTAHTRLAASISGSPSSSTISPHSLSSRARRRSPPPSAPPAVPELPSSSAPPPAASSSEGVEDEGPFFRFPSKERPEMSGEAPLPVGKGGRGGGGRSRDRQATEKARECSAGTLCFGKQSYLIESILVSVLESQLRHKTVD